VGCGPPALELIYDNTTTDRCASDASWLAGVAPAVDQLPQHRVGVRAGPAVSLGQLRPHPRRWQVQFPSTLFRDETDIILKINYVGDVGRARLNRKLIADNFYNGTPSEIDLRSWADQLENNKMIISVTALKKTARVSFDRRPKFSEDEVAELKSIRLQPIQRAVIIK